MVREDDLRATFSALHGEEAPPRAVTAADLIQRGRAVRSRRRTVAVAGSGLATVAVVGVALAVLQPAAPPQPLTPGPSATTSQVPPTTMPSPTSLQPSPTTVGPPHTPPRSAPGTTRREDPPGTSAPPTTVQNPTTSPPDAPASTTPATSR